MTRKFTLLFSTLVLLSLLAGACAQPTPEVQEVEVEVTRIVEGTPVTEIMVVTATPEPEMEAEEAELVIWHFNWQPQNNWSEIVIDRFMTKHPNVTVTYEVFPGRGVGGIQDMLVQNLATGTGPDVFFIQDAWTAQFASKGQLLALDDAALEAMGYESMDDLVATKELLPTALQGWNIDDVQYGLPNETSWLTIFLNKDCLADAGYDPETVDISTWDKLLAVAEDMSIKNADGSWVREGFDLPLAGASDWTMYMVNIMIEQLGGSILNEDQTKATINSPEGVATFEKLLEITTGDSGSVDFGVQDMNGYFNHFVNGQTCGIVIHPPRASITLGDMENIAAYAMPTFDNGVESNVFWGWGWQVSADSEHPDLAWKLIDELTSDIELHCFVTGFFIPVEGLADSPCFKENPGAAGYGVSVEQNPLFVLPGNPYFTEIRDLVQEYWELILFEGEEIQATLDDLAEQIDEVLAQ
jgi:multiple sugar transport system substrate-binding protein